MELFSHLLNTKCLICDSFDNLRIYNIRDVISKSTSYSRHYSTTTTQYKEVPLPYCQNCKEKVEETNKGINLRRLFLYATGFGLIVGIGGVIAGRYVSITRFLVGLCYFLIFVGINALILTIWAQKAFIDSHYRSKHYFLVRVYHKYDREYFVKPRGQGEWIAYAQWIQDTIIERSKLS